MALSHPGFSPLEECFVDRDALYTNPGATCWDEVANVYGFKRHGVDFSINLEGLPDRQPHQGSVLFLGALGFSAGRIADVLDVDKVEVSDVGRNLLPRASQTKSQVNSFGYIVNSLMVRGRMTAHYPPVPLDIPLSCYDVLIMRGVAGGVSANRIVDKLNERYRSCPIGNQIELISYIKKNFYDKYAMPGRAGMVLLGHAAGVLDRETSRKKLQSDAAKACVDLSLLNLE